MTTEPVDRHVTSDSGVVNLSSESREKIEKLRLVDQTNEREKVLKGKMFRGKYYCFVWKKKGNESDIISIKELSIWEK